MTASVQTSSILNKNDIRFKNYAYRCEFSENIYQASIADFDGDEYEYEVMANTYEEAAAILESMAADDGIQISYMNIYLVG